MSGNDKSEEKEGEVWRGELLLFFIVSVFGFCTLRGSNNVSE